MSLTRRRWLHHALGGSCLLCGGRSWHSDAAWGQAPRPARAARAAAPPPATEQVVRRGLEYLVRVQNEDGSFGTGIYARNVGVCSLAGLAFMAHGSTPGRGPFATAVDRCLAYVLNCCQESGFITLGEAVSHGPMYEHGFATLLLAECYGMSPQPALRSRLAAAVRLIVEKQNSEGGWRYFPERSDADISVTICQIMALRAARNAGLYVPPTTIERCVDYIKRSQNADGGFMYQLSLGGPSKFPRSAAAIVALHNAGIYEGEEIERARQYVLEFLPQKDRVRGENHYLYGHYYAVQAMWQAGGDYWRKWYPAIEADLASHQEADGSWLDSVSPVYGTAMACLILLMPRNHLPIFQK
ncbi:MAG: prenyltransferase/squalene oxidase repeat-containing protein [Pirellulales bacterium]